jgi:type IV pilus assembly protein PilC
MAEYRFDGTSLAGRPVRGLFTADNLFVARKKAHGLSKSRNFRLSGVRKKVGFLYSVQKDGRVVRGEQKAFSKQEVQQALERMGFQVLKVQRNLVDFQMKPSLADIVAFVRVSADLLREKLPYNEILQLLSSDITNRTLRSAVKEINSDLKQGKDSEKAFAKHENIFGKFTARMLGIASKSGNMAEVYESAAKFMERRADFKKSLRSALITPSITMLVLLAAVVFYVGYIFPETAELFSMLNVKLPPMTAATLQLSHFLTNNIFFIMAIPIVLALLALRYFTSERGRLVFDKFILKIPVIGSLLHKTAIEIFCRVVHSLYSGSGENIEVLRIAGEACGNKHMEHQIKSIAIPMMLNEGKGLAESLEAANVFTETAISRFRAGAETGTVKNSSLQLANYYEKETVYKLKNVVDMVQIYIALVIFVVITALTIVSAETATISVH